MLEKAYLEITNICNMACDFCHGTCRTPREMTLAEFEALTDRLVGRVEYLYFHLMGEPLLHPLLPRFIDRAREKGFRPMLTTNGSLLGEVGELLLQSPPHRISISLHAPAANPCRTIQRAAAPDWRKRGYPSRGMWFYKTACGYRTGRWRRNP